jgi:hypothetical protein
MRLLTRWVGVEKFVCKRGIELFRKCDGSKKCSKRDALMRKLIYRIHQFCTDLEQWKVVTSPAPGIER